MRETKYRVIEIGVYGKPGVSSYNVQKREYEDYPGGGSYWADINETFGFTKHECIDYVNSKMDPTAKVVYEV